MNKRAKKRRINVSKRWKIKINANLLFGPSSGLSKGVPGAEETASQESWAGLLSLEASDSSDELENVRPGIEGLRRGLR